jgi:hypothetical protein
VLGRFNGSAGAVCRLSVSMSKKKLGRIDLERISLFSDTSQHLWVQLQRRYGKIEAPHGQIFTSTSVVLFFFFFPCCMYPLLKPRRAWFV